MGLASFAFCYYKAVNGKLAWTDQAALLVICLSAILTLLLIFGGYLQLYPVIEGLNLLLILGISLALLLRKNANRVFLLPLFARTVEKGINELALSQSVQQKQR